MQSVVDQADLGPDECAQVEQVDTCNECLPVAAAKDYKILPQPAHRVVKAWLGWLALT